MARRRDSEARWREHLKAVPFNVVAYLDETLAGMASGMAPSPEGVIELLTMYVAPFARGTAPATRLWAP